VFVCPLAYVPRTSSCFPALETSSTPTIAADSDRLVPTRIEVRPGAGASRGLVPGRAAAYSEGRTWAGKSKTCPSVPPSLPPSVPPSLRPSLRPSVLPSLPPSLSRPLQAHGLQLPTRTDSEGGEAKKKKLAGPGRKKSHRASRCRTRTDGAQPLEKGQKEPCPAGRAGSPLPDSLSLQHAASR
jgi:hypothetical protein